MGGNSKKRAVTAGSLAGIALAAGVTWAPAGGAVAGAATGPAVDATHLTAKCDTVSAKIKFDGGLHAFGSGGGAGKLTIKGENCTTSNPATGGPGNVAIIAVLLKGPITFSSVSCSAITDKTEVLNVPSLTAKFKTAPGTAKLTQKESIVTGMVLSSSVDANGNPTFGPPPPGIDPTAVESGPFEGIDGGASTQFTLGNSSFLTNKEKCDSPGGLKTISMGDGSVFIG
ncbi:MAG: hypothetical protein WB565_14430 [Acidimicrobiales bacterium]